MSLSAGEQRTLSVPLSGVFGEVAVRAQPADAQLFIDGKPSGAANQTLRLVATTHDIEIRKAGFVDFKTSVTPRPGAAARRDDAADAGAVAHRSDAAVARTKFDQQLRLMPIGITMGARREPGRRANESQRDVEFKRGFYISVTEVTNGQFRKFKPEHRSGIVGNHTLDLDNQPVVAITWMEAALYCNWLSEQEGLPPAYEKKGETLVAVNPMTKGYRLPSDAEWEWAARNEGGGKLRRYPWGDQLPVAARSGNYADTTARLIVQDVIPDYDDGFRLRARRQVPGEHARAAGSWRQCRRVGARLLHCERGFEPDAGRPARSRGGQATRHPRRELETLRRDGSAARRATSATACVTTSASGSPLCRVSDRCNREQPPLRMVILLAVFCGGLAAARGRVAVDSEAGSHHRHEACKRRPRRGQDRGQDRGQGRGKKPKATRRPMPRPMARLDAKEPGKGSIADQAEAALKAAAEADPGSTAPKDAPKSAAEDDAQAPPSGSAGKGPSPHRFVPTEQVRADFDVSFPIDI